MKIVDAAAIRRNHRFQAEAMHRLVKIAESGGVRIVITRKTERHIAIELRSPWAYEVSRQGCECARFGIFGRCEHHALLLTEMGEIEDPKDIGWPDDPPVKSMVAD
jgi:hypothetical protein